MLLCVLSTRLLIYIKRYSIFGSFSLSFFSTLVFKLVTLIYIPPTVFNDPSFPTSSPEFVIAYLMISSSSGWGEIWVDISFALSWRLRMVDIFSYISRPFVLLLKAVWSFANQPNIPHFEMLPTMFLVPISGIIPALHHYLNSFVSIFNSSCI